MDTKGAKEIETFTKADPWPCSQIKGKKECLWGQGTPSLYLALLLLPNPFRIGSLIFGIFIEIGIVSVELWSTRDHSGVHKHACFYCFYFLEWLLCASPLVQLFY